MRRASDGRWRTRFGSWAGKFTVRRIVEELTARDLPVDVRTVHHWIAGDIAPRPARAQALVEMSGWSLAMEDVYRHREEVRRS